jgi:hypothetical protein
MIMMREPYERFVITIVLLSAVLGLIITLPTLAPASVAQTSNTSTNLFAKDSAGKTIPIPAKAIKQGEQLTKKDDFKIENNNIIVQDEDDPVEFATVPAKNIDKVKITVKNKQPFELNKVSTGPRSISTWDSNKLDPKSVYLIDVVVSESANSQIAYETFLVIKDNTKTVEAALQDSTSDIQFLVNNIVNVDNSDNTNTRIKTVTIKKDPPPPPKCGKDKARDDKGNCVPTPKPARPSPLPPCTPRQTKNCTPPPDRPPAPGQIVDPNKPVTPPPAPGQIVDPNKPVTPPPAPPVPLPPGAAGVFNAKHIVSDGQGGWIVSEPGKPVIKIPAEVLPGSNVPVPAIIKPQPDGSAIIFKPGFGPVDQAAPAVTPELRPLNVCPPGTTGTPPACEPTGTPPVTTPPSCGENPFLPECVDPLPPTGDPITEPYPLPDPITEPHPGLAPCAEGQTENCILENPQPPPPNPCDTNPTAPGCVPYVPPSGPVDPFVEPPTGVKDPAPLPDKPVQVGPFAGGSVPQPSDPASSAVTPTPGATEPLPDICNPDAKKCQEPEEQDQQVESEDEKKEGHEQQDQHVESEEKGDEKE